MAAERWFIARNKEKVGPFSAGDLKQLAHHGLLKPVEYVWVDGASKWVPAASLPGLFPQAGETKYWVVVAGKTRGPFIADQIRAALNAHQFSLESQGCVDEVRQWRPLSQFPEFRDFKLETLPLTPSRANLLVSSMEFEEATLHLAGKEGDATAKLISTLLDMKRKYAGNASLVEGLEVTISALRARRGVSEKPLPIPPKPAP